LKVAVIGTGHVGLVTCATLAHIGHDVCGIDISPEKIAALRAGTSPFFEPGLQELLSEGLDSGRLSFGSDPAQVLPGARVIFICVGTPADPDGHANLAAVEGAAMDISRHADQDVVVVEKSTVPAGTGDRVRETLFRERRGAAFHVVSNPEFLREGSAVKDSLEPDRLVVGADDEEGFATMRELYEPLTSNGVRLIETDTHTAELAKHSSNAFLALKISYANALARICELAGGDIRAVTAVMGADPRIGPSFLDAGLGYGGYCFPKDVAAFERLASRLGYAFPLLSEVARINGEAVEATVRKLGELVWNIPGKRIAILGLAFKPETDDIRFSPALALAQRLMELGAEVVGYDPQAASEAKAELPALIVAADPYVAAEGAHALVIATAWPEFRTLDPARLHEAMTRPVILDCRGAIDEPAFAEAGFELHPVGRAPIQPRGE
jgi:UDPglucose 6-dehydrogenase